MLSRILIIIFIPLVALTASSVDYWDEKPSTESFSPGGINADRNSRGRRNPIRVDTMVQLDDGIAEIKLNRRDRRFQITSPSSGEVPIIQVTGRGTNTTTFVYKADVVAFKDNEYIKITSDVNTDTSWVFVSMLIK